MATERSDGSRRRCGNGGGVSRLLALHLSTSDNACCDTPRLWPIAESATLAHFLHTRTNVPAQFVHVWQKKRRRVEDDARCELRSPRIRETCVGVAESVQRHAGPVRACILIGRQHPTQGAGDHDRTITRRIRSGRGTDRLRQGYGGQEVTRYALIQSAKRQSPRYHQRFAARTSEAEPKSHLGLAREAGAADQAVQPQEVRLHAAIAARRVVEVRAIGDVEHVDERVERPVARAACIL